MWFGGCPCFNWSGCPGWSGGNNGFDSCWGIIIVVIIIFFLFWGSDNRGRC